ncbi:MAG: sulfite exporter TauE/SafE family protein [bacterium]|nr:sulfite exporter TauE/SafE family protein [bacterium]
MGIAGDNIDRGSGVFRIIGRLVDVISSGKYNVIIYTAAFVVALLFSTRSGAAEQGLEVQVFSWLSLAVFGIAFLCGYFDASLGMGYGSTLTVILLLVGFTPLQIIPVVLTSQFLGGIAGGFAHHKVGNVNLKPGSRPFKIAVVMGLSAIVPIISAVWLANYVSEKVLAIIIGTVIATVGIIVLLTYGKSYKFRWWKMVVLGTVAAFNKSISGGGYGPLVTGGQIISGIKGREAVGITHLAEGFVCIGALAVYFIFGIKAEWGIAPAIILGEMASVPLAAITVKAVRSRTLNLIIGFFTTILGLAALVKALL